MGREVAMASSQHLHVSRLRRGILALPPICVALLQVLERRGVASGSDDEPGNGSGSGGGGTANGRRRDGGSPHKSKSAGVLGAGGAGQQQQRGAGGGGGGGLAAAAKAVLRGVEPELFNPEDLLSATGSGDRPNAFDRAGSDGGTAAAARRPGLASIPGAGDDAAGKGSWFANWFANARPGGGDETASDPGADDAALRRPPPVGVGRWFMLLSQHLCL